MASSRVAVVLSVAACLLMAAVVLYRSSANTSWYLGTAGSRQASDDEQQNQLLSADKPCYLEDVKSMIRPIRDGTPPNSSAAMYQRLVVFTAFSSNHFKESLDMIGSVQKYLPHTKIIVYDIGLTTEERRKVAKYCNAELRTFDFTRYPPHVKNIGNYAWRPFMLQELAQEYDVILYGDASLRMTGYNISKALESLLDFPFLDVRPDNDHPIIALTHEKQIEYFNFPPSRQYMANWMTVQATAWFLLVNDLTREKIIAPWVDCVSHEECVAPKGATRGPCNFRILERKDGSYVGCHRYIQSALNIILVKEFGLGIWDKVVREKIMDPVAIIVRHPQGIYPVKSYPGCYIDDQVYLSKKLFLTL